ncbi:DUF2383 domain-containing protein [Methylovulum miyakonense]|uniref:DUF2383 domain-containing protein n=1 Tax=Methylovulum miyakonense TaxID=645578 RepID=UPI0003693F9F|nr:DUF2383 domain-containing protein [Methylovulum miyakonense]
MHHIEQIEKLLKDELSATETYLQALDKFKEDVGLGEAEHLIPIYEDHKDAVSSLQALTLRLGGTPAEDSGAWGAWAKIILGGASMLGKESVLRTLQEGEINGAEDYRRALEDTELLADIRALIETQLLPAQQGHINALERLLAVEA